jgi:hypothetical protein
MRFAAARAQFGGQNWRSGLNTGAALADADDGFFIARDCW